MLKNFVGKPSSSKHLRQLLVNFRATVGKLLILVSILIANLNNSNAFAQGTKELTIISNTQTVNQTSNGFSSVFEGNVAIKYDDVNLTANTVTLNVINNQRIVTAIGNPVVITSPQRSIKIVSQKIVYNLEESTIAANEATITRDKDVITSSNIIYNLKTQSIQATGSKQKQVITTIRGLP